MYYSRLVFSLDRLSYEGILRYNLIYIISFIILFCTCVLHSQMLLYSSTYLSLATQNMYYKYSCKHYVNQHINTQIINSLQPFIHLFVIKTLLYVVFFQSMKYNILNMKFQKISMFAKLKSFAYIPCYFIYQKKCNRKIGQEIFCKIYKNFKINLKKKQPI